MFSDIQPLSLPKSKELYELTFFIGDEEFPKWALFGDEWIELDEVCLDQIFARNVRNWDIAK